MAYKSYYHYMLEISQDDLYESLLGYGLFTDKLPPVFTSESFYNYCLKMNSNFQDRWYGYIKFDSMRNCNVPRQFSIPHPFAYERLCKALSLNWNNYLIPHFLAKTANNYKVSTIHLRKMKNTKALFQMNYDNYKTDGSPENDLMIGKRILVRTDVSTCFPSIYSHSIAWALVGKNCSKRNVKDRTLWFNEIDDETSKNKNGETHGLLIGPHASNLISEVILTAVDSKLSKYDYLRHIDDYEMYAADEKEAEEFLIDLARELGEYDLILNHKKTEIIKLPITQEKDWVRNLNSFVLETNYGKTDFLIVRSYLDLAVELALKNNNASAILYAFKVLADRNKFLTNNAKALCLKEAMHFAFIFPYLIPSLKEFVFDIYPFDTKELETFVNKLFAECLKKNNFEGTYYCLYFAIEYNLIINDLNEDLIIASNNCVVKTILFIYCKKYDIKTILAKLNKHAEDLLADQSDFDDNWLFVYEVLNNTKFVDIFKNMKLSKVSFIKKEYQF